MNLKSIAWSMTVTIAANKPRICIRADGWIRHDGGDRPVILPNGAPFDVQWTDGHVMMSNRHYFWRDTGCRSDVSFWRFSDVA